MSEQSDAPAGLVATGGLAVGSVGVAASDTTNPTVDLASVKANVDSLQTQLAESSDLGLKLSPTEAEVERAHL